jgi:uncharacterized C2H2 Zn-finger protein
MSTWVIRDGETKVRCPRCAAPNMAILQQPERKSIGFMLCFECRHVREIGKGAVEKEKE